MPSPLPVLALLGALLAACSTGSRADEENQIGTPLPLDPERPEINTIGELTFKGALELRSSNPRFGGFSAMLLSADGKALVALSDRGRFFRLSIIEDETACLTGIASSGGGRLLEAPRGRLSRQRDSEGMTRAGDGIYVTFEGRHAVWRFEGSLDGTPVEVQPPPGMRELARNLGVEAIAGLSDGRLLMIAEDGEGDDIPAWVGGREGWKRLSYRRTGNFHPTDAALLPSGDVLVLERAFSFLEGFAARIVRIPAATIVPGARLIGTEVARIAPPLVVDNFEAIAVRPESGGEVSIFLLSDDNFNFVQRTILMQFGMKDPS